MFLYKLERKFGKYAIQNLSLYLIVAYIIGYVISLVNYDIYTYLMFNPYAIFHGEIWRIFTWVLTLPVSENILFAAIMLYFYYSIGTMLERTWGAFRYNVYIFSGMIFTVLAGLIMYFVLAVIYKNTGDATVLNIVGLGEYANFVVSDDMQKLVGMGIGCCVSTYYIYMSILLAFAATYPEMEVLLYFIIPVKIKWLAIVYAVLGLYDAFISSWGNRVMIFASLLNFGIFFLTTKNYTRISPREMKRKSTFRKKVREAQVHAVHENGARHKCAICGRTELDDPDLVFRFCSKCTGGKEYCQEHLFTHEHR